MAGSLQLGVDVTAPTAGEMTDEVSGVGRVASDGFFNDGGNPTS